MLGRDFEPLQVVRMRAKSSDRFLEDHFKTGVYRLLGCRKQIDNAGPFPPVTTYT